VLGHPDTRHVEVPELVGSLDAEEPGPVPPLQRPPALDQPLLAHHAQHPLAVDRPAEPASRPRADEALAIGRVGLGLGDARRLDVVRPAAASATPVPAATSRRGRSPGG
jgi:hypothetical protein